MKEFLLHKCSDLLSMLQINWLSINTRVELQIAEQSTLIPHFKHNQALVARVSWEQISEGAFAEVKFAFLTLPRFCRQMEKCKLKATSLISSTHHPLATAEPESNETWSSDKSMISATSCAGRFAPHYLANHWKMSVSRENGVPFEADADVT